MVEGKLLNSFLTWQALLIDIILHICKYLLPSNALTQMMQRREEGTEKGGGNREGRREQRREEGTEKGGGNREGGQDHYSMENIILHVIEQTMSVVSG